MKTNNKGISYIELVLVMSIALILTGVFTLTIGLINRSNVNRSAEKVFSSVNEARTASLVKGTDKGVLAMTCKNGSVYCYVGDDITTVDFDNQKWDKIATSPVSVSYINKDGTKGTMAEGVLVKTKFKQSSGEVTEGCINFNFDTNKSTAGVKIYKLTGKPEIVI